MNAETKIGSLICAVMIATSGLTYYLTPRVLLADTLPTLNLEKDFPEKIGPWVKEIHAELTIPDPETAGVIKSIYTDVLSRVYTNPSGKQIFLSVAYGKNQSDGHALHYPEICYPAQGFVISEKKSTQIKIGGETIPAKHLIASRGSQIEPITYWATIGTNIILNGTAHKVAQLRYGFNGIIPDGMIIRASSIGTNPEEEYELQRDFLDSMIRELTPETRHRVIGEFSNNFK